MKKFKISTIIILVCLLASLAVSVYTKKNRKDSIELGIKHRLPNVIGTTISGKNYQLRSLDNMTSTLIIIFNPSCEHCDYEAKQILKHASQLKMAQILMISDDKIESIRKFQVSHSLEKISNVSFIRMDADRIFETFGSVMIPQLYLYDANNNLRHTFKGEVDMKQVIRLM